MTNINDLEKLKEWLTLNEIDISKWGTGDTKSVENLWDELVNGDIQLLDNPPSRVVNVVEISIRRDNYVLIEAEQEFDDGKKRTRDRLPSEKIKVGEDHSDAALRCLEEELGIDRKNVILAKTTGKPQKVFTDSPSYPGLATQFTFHPIVAKVNGLPIRDFWRDNAAFEYGDPVKRQKWSWQERCVIFDPKQLLKEEENDTSILERLRRTSKLTILEQITIGHSGSGVYLVDATGHDGSQIDGLHYCKIYRTTAGEEAKINEMVSRTQIGDHIARLVDSTPYLNGWMASLYAVAHQTTLSGSQSLSNLILKNMLASNDSIKKLVELLENWNSSTMVRKNSSPHTLLMAPLQRYMIGSEKANKDITTRIESLVDEMAADIRDIQFGRKVLPNPLAYLVSDELWEGSRSILWPSGHVHGDLHTNNIICPFNQKLKTVSGYPVIIDFDTYESDGCVFYDLAYLELDLAMRMLPPANPKYREAWPMISELLSREIQLQPVPPLIPESIALYNLLVPIRNAVRNICDILPGDFEAAYWIIRTSAGLSFARKRKISSAERMLVLLLAAESLEKALEELEIEQKQSQQPIWIRWFD